jgi:putative transcriptional regulator
MTISSFIGPEGRGAGTSGFGLAGRFLVAMPQLDGTPFAQSLVLVCSHDEEHAFGVVVNKPIGGLYMADIVSEMDIRPSPSALMRPVHFGGPVDMQRGALLHSLDWQTEETLLVGPGIGLTATRPALQAVNDQEGPRDAVLFMGHAAWGPAQLDEEIKANAWLDAAGDPERIFGEDPGRAWHDVLSSLGASEASLSAVGVWNEAPLPN